MAIGIIYSRAQGRVRRIVVETPGFPRVDYTKDHVGPGESVLVIVPDKPVGPDECQAILNETLGKQHTSDRCAVVDKDGKVVHVVHADPNIDSHPAGTIVQHDTANIGDVLK
jgi:hypothetical protein